VDIIISHFSNIWVKILNGQIMSYRNVDVFSFVNFQYFNNHNEKCILLQSGR
jgi:hypothetical protein